VKLACLIISPLWSPLAADGASGIRADLTAPTMWLLDTVEYYNVVFDI
jgi:hypothetical protein